MNTIQTAPLRAAAAAIIALAVSGGALFAQKPAATSNAAVRAAIAAGNKKFADGAATKNATLIASAYTADAEAYPANSGIVKGRPALQKMWQSVLDSGIAAIELKTVEVESAGPFAYEVGSYTMKATDGKVADQGKYVVVWKQVDGQWRLHRDIWTTSMPAATK